MFNAHNIKTIKEVMAHDEPLDFTVTLQDMVNGTYNSSLYDMFDAEVPSVRDVQVGLSAALSLIEVGYWSLTFEHPDGTVLKTSWTL